MPKKGIGQKLILFFIMVALGIGLIVGVNQMVKTSDDQEQARTEQVEQLDEAEAGEETDEASTPEPDQERDAEEENTETDEDEAEKQETPEDKSDTANTEEKRAPDSMEKKEQPKAGGHKKEGQQSFVKKEAKEQPSSEKSSKPKEQPSTGKPSKPKEPEVPKETEKAPPKQEVVETSPPPPPAKKTAQLTVVGSEDIGTILNTVEVEIQESDTVLDVLQRTLREKKVQISVRGGGAGAYVEGINNLYEFDKGPGSGWMYSVNGSFPNRSAGVWPVKEGEHIRWLYTLDLGKDLGAGQ